MKITYRIPTQDPYAFVEVVEDIEVEERTPEFIQAHYQQLTDAFRTGVGLSEKDIDKFLEEYLNTGTVVDGTELYAEMSKEQQKWIQCIKRAIKRIEAKSNKSSYEQRAD